MMKATTSFALLAALIASGCNKKKEEGTTQKSDPAMTPKTTEAPAEPPPPAPLTGTALADKYKSCMGLVSDGKLDDFKKECLADDFVMHGMGMPDMKGADAVIGMMKDERTAFPDMKHAPQLVMVSGRNVLAVNLLTGTNSGPMKSPTGEEMPATNKKIGMMWFHHLAINEQNKATEEWPYFDVGTMMGQLGMMPKGAPPVRPAMDKGMEGAPIVVVTADNDQEKANMEAVKKGNDAFVANKPADMFAMMADDAVETDMSSEKDVTGKKEIEKGFKEFRNAWSDVQMNDVQMWAAGDWVVQTVTFHGKNDKPMGKMKPTGKTVDVPVAEVMHFKDGKIDHTWRFMNSMQFAEQMGMAPPPPAQGSAAAAPEKK